MAEAIAVVEALQAASILSTLNQSTMSLSVATNASTSALTAFNASSSAGEKKVLPLKLALFNLQKYIKEADFAVEFMLKGGLGILVKLIERDVGGMGANSLAVGQAYFVVYQHLEGLELISVRPARDSGYPGVRISLVRLDRNVHRPHSAPSHLLYCPKCA